MGFSKVLRTFIVTVFIGIVILMVIGHSEHFSITKHSNPKTALQKLDLKKYVGSIQQQGWTPKHIQNLYQGGLIDTVLSKKWDSFVFVTYNYYIVEVTIVDLGLIGQVSISLTSYKDKQQIVGQYLVSQKLDDFFKGDIQINTEKLKFQLKRNQTQTSHDVSISFKAYEGNKTITGNLKQSIPTSNCLTFVRPYSSIKCLTGKSEGAVNIEYKIINTQYNYIQEINNRWEFNQKVATVLYDGFRGAGYNWYWVWAFGIGWTDNIQLGATRKYQIKNVGISLGFMLGKEQNFITIQGENIKLDNVQYEIHDGLNKSKLVFRSNNPKGQFNFTVKQNVLYDDDKVLTHKHIEKAYGVWNGKLKLPNGTLFEFEKSFGAVEICKSRF